VTVIPTTLFHRKPRQQALTVLILVILILAPVAAFGQPLWSDEFDSGALPDSQVWSYDLGAGGWGNQELQEYTDDLENARVEGGNLVIAARQKLAGMTPVGFTSARLRTEEKLMFLYGTIEARIKVPDLQDGLWPAFWTLGSNFSEVGWPRSGEMDILEMGWKDAIRDGLVNRWVSMGAFWEFQGSTAQFGRVYSPILTEPMDLNGEYHVFSMDWTPDSIVTFLDGNEIWRMNIDSENCVDCEEFHQPHFIILNMAVGEQPDGSPLAVIYWYIYDDLGNPIFMLGSGVPDGNRVEIELVSPVGMVYGEFDPDSVLREDGGTAVFEFSDGSTGTFSYTPSTFSSDTWGHTAIDALPLTRLFGIPAPETFNAPPPAGVQRSR